MLTDFFRINLPYGMQKNDQGEWMVFNREYVPLGWNDSSISDFRSLPIYTKYTKLTDAALLELAHDKDDGITRNDKGEIVKVFFYNDRTNPHNNTPEYWDRYFDKIKSLSKSDVKGSPNA